MEYWVSQIIKELKRVFYIVDENKKICLIYGLQLHTNVDSVRIIKAWKFYMMQEYKSVLQKEFLENMEKKISD